MAIVCLTSGSGSPGVTTTAVGMAFSWPRPVLLAEADPTGGSGVLAGFLRGTTPYDAGLIELALSPLGTTDALRDVEATAVETSAGAARPEDRLTRVDVKGSVHDAA